MLDTLFLPEAVSLAEMLKNIKKVDNGTTLIF